MHHPGARRRRRPIVAVVIVAVLVLAAAGAGAGYLLLRTHGSPRQTAASYLAAWGRGDYAAMGSVSVNVPPGGLAGPVRQAAEQTGMRGIHLVLGRVTGGGATAQAQFTVTAALASGHTWTYSDQLALVKRDRRWWVNWSPAAIYPKLRAGERFTLSAAWPARAGVLAADGTDLSSPRVIAESGSLSLLTGTIVKATAAQAKALGAPYQAGDLIGSGGIEQAYQKQLAGLPALTIKLAGPGARAAATPPPTPPPPTSAARRASRSIPASTCATSSRPRTRSRRRPPPSRSTWSRSSPPPARSSPWWSARAASTARSRASSRPAPPSRS
jgi:hypothetical protein